MLEVQRRLATRLARPKRSGKPERFHPHLTLCRFAEGTRRPASGHWTAPLPPEGMMFHVEQVWLMSSELRASGARHERVHGVRLG
jgi:2'-5' RNA ligase